MSNYDNFISGNYNCSNCNRASSYTPSYSGAKNSGFHGSYSEHKNSDETPQWQVQFEKFRY